MAIQTLMPGYNPSAALGQSLGQGLGGVLEGLASNKVKQMHQQQQAQSLQSVLGNLSPDKAQGLAGLFQSNPKAAQSLLADLLSKQEGAELQRAIGGIFGQQQPESSNPVQQQISNQEQPSQLDFLNMLNQGKLPQNQQQNQFRQQALQAQPQIQKPIKHDQKIYDLSPKSIEKILKFNKETGKAIDQRKQTEIDKTQTKWLQGISKADEVSSKALDIYDQLEEIARSGKLQTGLLASKKPISWLNDETQQFISLANQLAGLNSLQFGNPTNAKIKFSETTKPNIQQSINTILNRIESGRKEAIKVSDLVKLKDQVLAENDYKIPEGLETKVNQLYKYYDKHPEYVSSPEQGPVKKKGEDSSIEKEIEKPNESLSNLSNPEYLLKRIGNPFGQKTNEENLRNIARSAARTGEGLLGAPGNLLSGAISLGNTASNVLTGHDIIPERVQDFIPTTETAKKYGTDLLAKVLPEKYLESQSEAEAESDRFFSTLASLASPLVGPLKLGATAALKAAGAGSLAAFATRGLGADKDTQDIAHAGGTLVPALWGIGKALIKAKDFYKLSSEVASEGGGTNGHSLKNAVAKTDKKISRGYSESKEIAKKFLESVEAEINPTTGEIPLESLVALKEDLNELSRSRNESSSFASNKHLAPIKEALQDTIKSSAKEYPEFANNLLEADELYAGIKQQEKVLDAAKNSSSFKKVIEGFKSPWTTALFGGGALLKAAGLSLHEIAGIGAGINLIKLGIDAGKIVAKNPSLQKHYIQAMKGIAQNNIPIFVQNVRKLDKGLQKEE